MKDYYDLLLGYRDEISNRMDFVPELGLVLGSGLGAYADSIRTEYIIDYDTIPNFPVSTNEMHAGQFIFGYVGNAPVAAMRGRLHYYEGYSMEQVTAPIRLLKMLGCSKIIITNAAGAINEDLKIGDLMLITDHISSFVPSPLRGENIDELGIRFPDMSRAYEPKYIEIAQNYGKSIGLDLKKGVYVQTAGPNYESPAEIRMYKAAGADAVGMSTACETTVAVHCGMKVLGISCITNMASGISGNYFLSDSEVSENAAKSSHVFGNLLNGIIPLL